MPLIKKILSVIVIFLCYNSFSSCVSVDYKSKNKREVTVNVDVKTPWVAKNTKLIAIDGFLKREVLGTVVSESDPVLSVTFMQIYDTNRKKWYISDNDSKDTLPMTYEIGEGKITIKVDDEYVYVSSNSTFDNAEYKSEIKWSNGTETEHFSFVYVSNYQAFEVALLSDLHLDKDHASDRLRSALNYVKVKFPDTKFGIVNGDIQSSPDSYLFDNFEKVVKNEKLGWPIFFGYGNHDGGNDHQEIIYEVNERADDNFDGNLKYHKNDNGNTSWVLKYKNWAFVQLNWNPNDLDWVEDRCSDLDDRGFNLCFCMHSFDDYYSSSNDPKWKEIIEVMKAYPDSVVLSGHRHWYQYKTDKEKHKSIRTGRMGWNESESPRNFCVLYIGKEGFAGHYIVNAEDYEAVDPKWSSKYINMGE